MSKLQELIRELCPNGVEYKKLGEIADYPKERTSIKEIDCYVGVENLLKDKQGVCKSKIMPNSESAILFIPNDILIGNIRPYLKKIWLADTTGGTNGDVVLIRVNKNYDQIVNRKFLYFILSSDSFFIYDNNYAKGGKMPRGDKSKIKEYEIPLPPLEVQEEIVRILDHFTNLAAELQTELQAELQARKEQYEYYRNKLLTFGKNAERIEWKRLEDVLHSIRTGLNPRKFFKLNTPDATSYYVTIREFNGGNLTFTDSTDRINETARILCNNRSNLEYNDVLFSGTGTIGETYVIDNIPSNWNIKEGVYSLKPKIHIILPKYLKYILSQSDIKASYLKLAEGGTVKSISMRKLGNFPIPVPSLSEQQRIVSILDKFEALVNDLSEGLPAEIAAVQEQYEYYRNKLLSFPKLAVA